MESTATSKIGGMIEVRTSEGKTYQVPVDDYLKTKKLQKQVDMVVKIALGYIMQAIVSFFHAIILLNIIEE